MWLRQNVTKAKCYQGKMWLRQNVTKEKCYQDKMLPRQNVTRQKELQGKLLQCRSYWARKIYLTSRKKSKYKIKKHEIPDLKLNM